MSRTDHMENIFKSKPPLRQKCIQYNEHWYLKKEKKEH